MGLECGWRHAQKRWSWEFEVFEKTSVEYSAVEIWILTVEEVELDLAVERCSWVFRISTDRDLKHHKMHRALGWGQHIKNCVFLLVSLWTEIKKLINHSYLKQPSPPVFACSICIWLCNFVIDLITVYNSAMCTKKHVLVKYDYKWVKHGFANTGQCRYGSVHGVETY